MNDQEPKDLWQGLKCLWQEHMPSGDPTLTADEQIAAMRKKMAGLHRGLNKTDLLGLVIYTMAAVPFVIYFFTTPGFVTRMGYLIIIGGELFAAGKTIQNRRSIPQPVADAPVREWLKYDLAIVRQQAKQCRTVLWWYLLPFLIGMNVSTWGMPVHWLTKIPMSVLFALIAGVTYWLHQRAWRNQWLPMQQELEALLHSAETGEPLDETQVASLRPIALSMALADKVKPVEFKFAFRPIALYSEIGFVCIWLILILALEGDRIFRDLSRASIHFVSQVFSWPHLVLGVLFLLAGLLFSRILQKTTGSVVGVSTLGVHLYKGLSLLLWDEIKEVRTLRILNIRFLWLIRESGKKTIMPWTLLERQSDLKAAVENFAPANHPLRKYLSLLRPVARK